MTQHVTSSRAVYCHNFLMISYLCFYWGKNPSCSVAKPACYQGKIWEKEKQNLILQSPTFSINIANKVYLPELLRISYNWLIYFWFLKILILDLIQSQDGLNNNKTKMPGLFWFWFKWSLQINYTYQRRRILYLMFHYQPLRTEIAHSSLDTHFSKNFNLFLSSYHISMWLQVVSTVFPDPLLNTPEKHWTGSYTFIWSWLNERTRLFFFSLNAACIGEGSSSASILQKWLPQPTCHRLPVLTVPNPGVSVKHRQNRLNRKQTNSFWANSGTLLIRLQASTGLKDTLS